MKIESTEAVLVTITASELEKDATTWYKASCLSKRSLRGLEQCDFDEMAVCLDY